MNFPEDIIINLHTTERCNLNCKYCYDKKKETKDPIYKIEELINFIKKIKCKNLDIMFYGGEPTCNLSFIEKIMDKLESLKTPKVCFQLQTNGTRLTEIPQNILSRLYQILISFDGTEQTMIKQRGKDVYRKILQGLDYLRSYYTKPVIARMTLTNYETLQEDLFETYNIFNFIYFQIDNSLKSKYHKRFFSSYESAITNLFERWYFDLSNKKVLKYILPFFGILFYDNYFNLENSYLYCSPGYYCLTIDTEGRIFSCPEGTYRSSHTQEIKCYMGKIIDLKLTPYMHPKKKICQDCNVFYLCRGRCIWTTEIMYCKATIFIISLLRKNYSKISKLIDLSNLPLPVIKAIEAVEIIP